MSLTPSGGGNPASAKQKSGEQKGQNSFVHVLTLLSDSGSSLVYHGIAVEVWGNRVAEQIFEKFCDYLGYSLAATAAVIDPEIFILGGGVSKAGQVLIDGVEPYFHKYVFHAASNVQFALASLGNDAGAYGAFKLALDAFA